MGSTPEQPKALICDSRRQPMFYEMSLDLSGLTCVDVSGTAWALLVAYNRGALEDYKDTKMYQKIADITKNCDVVRGPIADDRIYNVLPLFNQNLITDRTLMDCMLALKLGNQYVAKTPRACSRQHIEIVSETALTREELLRLQQQKDRDRAYASDITQARIKAANKIKYKVGLILEGLMEQGEDDELEITPNPTL